MFDKVLIAKRGAVAARVLRSLRALGIRSVAVYSEADTAAPYLEEADETNAIGAAHPRESYLSQDVLIEVLKKSGADAVHPGYGCLAENPDFAERVAAAGATFIGPSPHWISAMGRRPRSAKFNCASWISTPATQRPEAMASGMREKSISSWARPGRARMLSASQAVVRTPGTAMVTSARARSSSDCRGEAARTTTFGP